MVPVFSRCNRWAVLLPLVALAWPASAQLFPNLGGNDLRQTLLQAAGNALNQANKPPESPPPPSSPTSPNAGERQAQQASARDQRPSAVVPDAPSATVRLADQPRRAWLLRTPGYGRKFEAEPGGRSLLITNPYMDPTRILLSTPVAMQCRADGGLVIASTGGFNSEGQTTVSGWWQVRPDGAVNGWVLKKSVALGSNAPSCNAPFSETPWGSDPFVVQADESLLVLRAYAVHRLERDGYLALQSGPQRMCREYMRGLEQVVDGPADSVRFANANQTPTGALDGEGRLWLSDDSYRRLRRMAPDGSVETLIGQNTSAENKVASADRVTFEHMVWDGPRGDMVMGGSILTHNQLYTTVWRVRPDGSARRVLLGHKVGKSPSGMQLDGVAGLALDSKGRILMASRNMDQDAVAIFRVDEARGTVQQITGMRLPRPAEPIKGEMDGPADRAYFNHIRRMCTAGDDTLFIQDDAFIRKLDTKGQVSTWVF